MRRHQAWVAALTALAFLPTTAAAASAPSSPSEHTLTIASHLGYPAVVLPPGLDVTLLARDVVAREEVMSAALAAVHDEAGAPEAGDVVFVLDVSGRVVDVDAASAAATLAAPVRSLSFTFDSPALPFTAAEITQLQAWIKDFYPVVVDIYGPPAQNITVNVRKDATVSSGAYSPWSNEIILSASPKVNVFVHEMVHAFHDTHILTSTWEETMARAVEVEAFDRVGTYEHPTSGHAYYHDLYVDAVNAQPAVGSSLMVIGDGFPNGLLRYEVGGYEWWKVHDAHPDFFRQFNQTIYGDPGRAYQEAALVEAAARAAPVVEGTPFTLWYVSKGVFNSAPPQGLHVVTLLGDAWLVAHEGFVRPIRDVPATWRATTADGTVTGAGSTRTTATGAISTPGGLTPEDYTGRVRLEYTATVGSEVVRGTSFLVNPTRGVFGVAPDLDAGTVTIERLDGPAPVATVPLVNGAFSAAELEPIRGFFRASLARPDGTPALTRYFTKDATPFFVLLEHRPTPVVNLKPVVVTAPAAVSAGATMAVDVPVKSVGASTAPPSRTRLLLSRDDVRDGADLGLAPLVVHPAVRPGERATTTHTVEVPATTAAGRYRLLSCVDEDRLVPETSETDNCKVAASVTVQAGPATPNLVVNQLSAPPAKVRRGKTFTAADTTRNVGTGPAGPTKSRYVLSIDKIRSSNDIVLTPARLVPALGPTQKSIGSVTLTVPRSAPAGRTYWLIACADDSKVVAEAKEGDNCRVGATMVKVTY